MSFPHAQTCHEAWDVLIRRRTMLSSKKLLPTWKEGRLVFCSIDLSKFWQQKMCLLSFINVYTHAQTCHEAWGRTYTTKDDAKQQKIIANLERGKISILFY